MKTKRVIAIAVAFALTLLVVPLTAFATSEITDEPEISETVESAAADSSQSAEAETAADTSSSESQPNSGSMLRIAPIVIGVILIFGVVVLADVLPKRRKAKEAKNNYNDDGPGSK